MKVQKTINKARELFSHVPKKGLKMTRLHMYSGGSSSSLSGIKACIFGGTASLAPRISYELLSIGTPSVMCHRKPMDVLTPIGDDPVFHKSNPYRQMKEFVLNWDTFKTSLIESRVHSELGMRYFQLVMDLTNEYDIENGIKDCDVVINLIGEKPVVKDDYDFEEPNILVPRAIAKVCARMQKEANVKRFIHFSAAGANPEAISRRLRTKWHGEQEVRKYFPQATIFRPTTVISNYNIGNFINYYLHCWHNNNGTVILVDDGKCLRQPVLDTDIATAVMNALQLEKSAGETYELGGLHRYNYKELLEFFSNSLNHRPRFISYSYEDLMKLNLSPNFNFEKACNWLLARPDFSSEFRTDIVVNKVDNVKTFEDLSIIPVASHHVLTDLGNWYMDRLAVERESVRNRDEDDANDDGQH